MGTAALAAAWLLSIAPLWLERLRIGELDFQTQSRLGWVLLPWLALVGLPRRASAGPAPFAMHGLVLALPLLVAAGVQDFRAGQSGGLHTAAVGTLLWVLLSWAAGRARASTRENAYGIAWSVLVPGAVLLQVALNWGASPGREATHQALSLLASASPLAWSFGRMSAEAGSSFAPIAAAWVLVVIAWGRPAREALHP